MHRAISPSHASLVFFSFEGLRFPFDWFQPVPLFLASIGEASASVLVAAEEDRIVDGPFDDSVAGGKRGSPTKPCLWWMITGSTWVF